MNENMKTKGRSAIYSMAGIYLVYTAYQIFENRADSLGGEYLAVMAVAAAFLAVGAGMVCFGLYTFYKIGKEVHEAQKRLLEQHMQEEDGGGQDE